MDGLLKRIHRVCPAGFCCRDFFLLHDNMPTHKSASVCQFLTPPKKCFNPLSPPVLSRFDSARLFSVPQVENEVKRTPLCRCCWDLRSHNWWIKASPKRGIFGSFSKNDDRAKASIYMPRELILHKKGMCLLHESFIFKKISPKIFGLHCVLSPCVSSS